MLTLALNDPGSVIVLPILLLHTVESIMAENLVDTESELEPDDSLILSYIEEPNLAVYSCHPDPIDSENPC